MCGRTPTPEFPAMHICERESRGQLGQIPDSALRTSQRRFPPTSTDMRKPGASPGAPEFGGEDRAGEVWGHQQGRRGESGGGPGRPRDPAPAGPPRRGRPAGRKAALFPLPRGGRPPPGPADGGGRVASLPRYLPQQETTRSRSCADLQAGEPSALPQGAITPARRADEEPDLPPTRSRSRRGRKKGWRRLAQRSSRLGER